VRVVGREELHAFMRKHPPAREALRVWLAEAEDPTWKTPNDVKDGYASLSIIKGHYVFDIGGNKYRLDCLINFDSEVLLVKRIGTHSEYDTWSFE
jgi:mRNA interferase HigB